jgi:hypothetical protein
MALHLAAVLLLLPLLPAVLLLPPPLPAALLALL